MTKHEGAGASASFIVSEILSLVVLTVMLVAVCLGGADFYATLGVSKDASPSEIKRAYRKLSLKYHPDKNPGADANKKYIELTNAYEILIDDDKRRIFDQYGEEGLKQQQQGHGGGGFDPFGGIFNMFNFGGQQGHGGQPQQQRGADVELELEASLKDLYVGRITRVTHKKQVLCNKCHGSGAKDANDVKTCTGCKGSGIKIKVQQLGPGFVQQVQQTCDECGGRGKKVTSKCPHCDGKKVKVGEETLMIQIEKGMSEGQVIKIEGMGVEAPDITPGDIIFRIVTLPHELFTRNGNDLRYRMSISLLEALTGFDTTIEHLDGHKVRVSRTDVTKPGFVMTIANEGMPLYEFSSEFGNLYIEFTVIFPTTLTNDQKQQFKTLLK
eukprot:gene7500-8776_t